MSQPSELLLNSSIWVNYWKSWHDDKHKNSFKSRNVGQCRHIKITYLLTAPEPARCQVTTVLLNYYYLCSSHLCCCHYYYSSFRFIGLFSAETCLAALSTDLQQNHSSTFYRLDPFLMPNQQRKSSKESTMSVFLSQQFQLNSSKRQTLLDQELIIFAASLTYNSHCLTVFAQFFCILVWVTL